MEENDKSNLFGQSLTTSKANKNTRSNPTQNNGTFDYKRRYVRKPITSVSHNDLSNKGLRYSPEKPKFKDSFWGSSESSNNLTEKDENKKFYSSNKLRLNKTSNFQPNSSKIDQSIDLNDSLNTSISNSVIKWSKQLNNSSPRINGFSYVDDTNDKFNKALVEVPFNKDFKKPKIEKNAILQPPAKLNHLFEIIERESTNFSVKMSYDKPFISSRNDILTPHTYLDLDIDSSLQLTRENTIRNMKSLDFNLLEGFKDDRTTSKTPDAYQTLQKLHDVNIYSELNIADDSLKVRKKIMVTARPSANAEPKNNRNNLKPESKIHVVQKPIIAVPQPIDLEQSLVLEKDEEWLNNEKTSSRPDFYTQNPLSESSNSVFDQLDKTTKSNPQTMKSPINDQKSYQKIVDASMLDSLISSLKLKDILKESPVPSKKHSPKQQPKSKSNSKKPVVKEFKYCILTDLKIGEGEFSETFQGYRYDLGPPLKIAAKRIKMSKEKDEQTIQNLLSEISVLSQLGKHNYVIDYLGVFNFNNTMYLVFEYAEKGDLKRLLDLCRKNGKREIHVNGLYKLRIAYEIASGMEYISSLDIVHKDLAARNILLDNNFSCKIADFGCCKAEFLSKRPSNFKIHFPT